ncbi:MAG: hypothetical protein QX197_12920 [Methylococcaceae bacterium]
MLTLLRQCLITFLVLLQLFAPLVHAHVNNQFSSDGLHLPGLEFHNAVYDASALQALPCFSNANNLIVSIDTGVRNKNKNNHSNNDNGDYIYSPVFTFNVAITATDINFSPQKTLIVNTLFAPPYAPRAPPLS